MSQDYLPFNALVLFPEFEGRLDPLELLLSCCNAVGGTVVIVSVVEIAQKLAGVQMHKGNCVVRVLRNAQPSIKVVIDVEPVLIVVVDGNVLLL